MSNSESILLQNLNITDGLFQIYNPRENRGLTYDIQERESLGLLGHLPSATFTMKEQVARAYLQYQRFDGLFEKSIYLRCLHDTNEHLFYSLVKKHLTEMIPVIYTPTVGEAVQKYSLEFRRPRGLYIAYPDRYKMVEILEQRTNKNVDIIVVSDSQGVLGIGDQGVGGMEIPVAKLMVYTLCAGISPRNHLPIVLDVGTDNQELLDDPLYVGWRNKRVSGDAYYEMMDLFIAAVKEVFPKTFLHWEDFGRDNAIYNLEKYREVLPSFNDDIQGTAAVTCSALISASDKAGIRFSEQKIVFYGAGAAALGISDMIVQIMQKEGLTKEQAKLRIWIIDSKGLLISDRADLNSYKQAYMRDLGVDNISDFNLLRQKGEKIGLQEVISIIKPTTLIGCSTQSGAFHEDMIKVMAHEHANPIIFPLSNPTKLSEACPQDLIDWSEGRALVATGSPFEPALYKGVTYVISQCNNALVFPGIGLGMVLSKAKVLTDNMLLAASFSLSKFKHNSGGLLPSIAQAPEVSRVIAKDVLEQAIEDGVARLESGYDFDKLIKPYL
jgi:malate dehydrogenase (oxaloacetate-decarboxylating)